MSNPFPRDRLLSIEEYFAVEQTSGVRHEYVNGQVHAMSGVTRRHSRIAGNVFGRLWTAARGGPCRVHQAEVMLRVGNVVYYPDVMTACGPEPRDARVELEPVLVVEVLSPTTERTDRGEKAMVYRGIPSLSTYLVIEQDERRVDRHWRAPDGHWQQEILVAGDRSDSVAIERPAMTLTLDDIYEGVEFPSPEERLRLREEAAAYG